MANYLYNGIPLPDINDGWDKETYPHLYLVPHEEENYVFCAGNSTFTVSSDGEISYTGAAYYLSDDGTWTLNALMAYTAPVLWTNTDLYTTDGTLYLPATAPIPVSTATTWKYNGVELPALPEVDWGTYPYVAIFYMADYNTAILITASNALIRVGNDINTVENGAPYWVYDPDGVMGTASGSWVKADDTTSGGLAEYFSWTNHNVYNEDGTTYLSLSSPVPVVTTKPLNFHLKSFLMGVVDELAGRPSIV